MDAILVVCQVLITQEDSIFMFIVNSNTVEPVFYDQSHIWRWSSKIIEIILTIWGLFTPSVSVNAFGSAHNPFHLWH